MRYLKTYEQAKDFYQKDNNVFIIVTEDEKWVFYKTPSYLTFMPIEILDKHFHKPMKLWGDSFIYGSEKEAKRMIEHINDHYFVYKVPMTFMEDKEKWGSIMDSGYKRKVNDYFKNETEEVVTKEPHQKLKLKTIEYQTGSQRNDSEIDI
jgi:hypothetical protein